MHLSTRSRLVYLLGGSGYIGNAYVEYMERNGIAFRSLSRSELVQDGEREKLKS